MYDDYDYDYDGETLLDGYDDTTHSPTPYNSGVETMPATRNYTGQYAIFNWPINIARYFGSEIALLIIFLFFIAPDHWQDMRSQVLTGNPDIALFFQNILQNWQAFAPWFILLLWFVVLCKLLIFTLIQLERFPAWEVVAEDMWFRLSLIIMGVEVFLGLLLMLPLLIDRVADIGLVIVLLIFGCPTAMLLLVVLIRIVNRAAQSTREATER